MNTKHNVEARVEHMLAERGFSVESRDFDKPWGGYFVIPAPQTQLFIQTFFPEQVSEFQSTSLPLSPKILVIAPGLRLSWQYHDRRGEFHKVLEGPVAYPLSATDEQSDPVVYQKGELVRIPQGMRHRLVGLDDWGVVAEIWQHTDVANPSNEADNHRVQDDFNRK